MGILNKWDQNSEGFLRQIVTKDKTWFYQYNPDDKAQSKQKQASQKERLWQQISGRLKVFC